MITLVDALMSEYHLSLREAVWEFPVSSALALWDAMIARHGGHTGPDYFDKVAVRARTKAREFLETHFRIVD